MTPEQLILSVIYAAAGLVILELRLKHKRRVDKAELERQREENQVKQEQQQQIDKLRIQAERERIEADRARAALSLQEEHTKNTAAIRDMLTFSMRETADIRGRMDTQQKTHEAEVERLTLKIDQLEQQLHERDVKEQKDAEEIRRLITQLASMQTQINELKEALYRKDTAIQQKDTQIAEMSREMAALRARLNDLEQRMKTQEKGTGELPSGESGDKKAA